MSKIDLARLSGGRLLDNDLLSFGPGIWLHENSLHDDAVNVVHTLHEQAAQGLRVLAAGGVRADKLIQSLNAAGLRETHIEEVLGFFETIGGLRVQRTPGEQLKVLWNQTVGLRFGAPWTSRVVREPATGVGICRSVIRASTPLLLASSVVALLALSSGLVSVSQPFFWAVVLTMLLTGTVAHEYAHAIVIRRHVPLACVLQQGTRIGILHGELPPAVGLRSALAGPLIGAVWTLGCGYALTFLPANQLYAVAGTVLALFHGASLLPLYGDGRAILHFFRNRTPHETSRSPH